MTSGNPTVQQPKSGVNRRFSTIRCISALALREMATRYGKSPGGYIWAIVEPMGMIVILALAFSLLVRTPSLGNSFLLFYATGYLPFNLYQTISSFMAYSIAFSKPLLFYPAVTWTDAILARFILNALTGILVMFILLTAISIVVDTRVVITIEPLVISIFLALLLAAGVGMLNCVLFGLYPVWVQIWSIATRPLFIISGVLFIYEDLPKAVQDILWYNPLMHVTGLARKGFFPTYHASYVDVTYVIICGLVPLFLGVVLMGRYHRDILNS
ncbi:MAG: ABC transporter permease [Pseudomonadota bacterium]